jgi:hypothetical protein
MSCNCRKFSPKGTKPKGVGGAGKPRSIKITAPKAGNQAAGYAKRYGIKVATPKPVKAKPAKVSARVGKYRDIEAKKLAKDNANPCKCTPGKP